MKGTEYRIVYTYSSREDMRKMKKYILDTFQYRTYLIFYVVDNVTMTVTVLRILKDGMDWQYIIKQWLKQNEL